MSFNCAQTANHTNETGMFKRLVACRQQLGFEQHVTSQNVRSGPAFAAFARKPSAARRLLEAPELPVAAGAQKWDLFKKDLKRNRSVLEGSQNSCFCSSRHPAQSGLESLNGSWLLSKNLDSSTTPHAKHPIQTEHLRFVAETSSSER